MRKRKIYLLPFVPPYNEEHPLLYKCQIFY